MVCDTLSLLLARAHVQVAKYGNYFSYHGSPRAQIYRRDAEKVVDMSVRASFLVGSTPPAPE